MKIGIIGAAGVMGRWFTNYFKSQGQEVTLYDLKLRDLRTFSRQANVKYTEDLRRLVRENEVLFVSVPIEDTISVVESILAEGVRGKCIVEIASCKKRIVDFLQRCGEFAFMVSLHPFFGPGAKGIAGKTVALVPVSDREGEMRAALKLFPSATIFPVDAETHDRIVAATLAGTFVLNLAWLSMISKMPVRETRRLMGAAAKLQYLIATSYLAQDFKLYSSLAKNNDYFVQALGDIIRGLREAKGFLNGRSGMERLHLPAQMGMNPPEAYAKLYEIVEELPQ